MKKQGGRELKVTDKKCQGREEGGEACPRLPRRAVAAPSLGVPKARLGLGGCWAWQGVAMEGGFGVPSHPDPSVALCRALLSLP